MRAGFNGTIFSSIQYHNICSEYLVQLNSELRTIYEELVDYELVEVEEH